MVKVGDDFGSNPLIIYIPLSKSKIKHSFSIFIFSNKKNTIIFQKAARVLNQNVTAYANLITFKLQYWP